MIPIAPRTIPEFIDKYSIPQDYVPAINGLRGRNIVMVGDNSGSMESPLFKNGSTNRWDKLLYYARVICDGAPLFDAVDGFDLCFLNPLSSGKHVDQYFIRNIKTHAEVEDCFKPGPQGGTPLIQRINEVINKYRSSLSEKDLILYVATDGLNTENGVETPGAMKAWVKDSFATDQLLRKHVHINFMLLSDDQKVIEEYNGVDKLKGPKGEYLSIDVTSPMAIEKKQFESANPGKKYTEGTEIGKMLTGASNRAMDECDEIKVEFTKAGNVNIEPQKEGCHCLIS